MIKDFYKDLLLGIIIVLLLLGVCVSVDYADDEINNYNESSLADNVPNGAIIVNNSSVVAVNRTANVIVAKHSDVIHTIKPKYPIVSMWARPSVRCNLPYKWYYRSFVDYCPHCRRYNVLYDAHKPQAKYEHEWTCKRCGADYDAVIGKEKYSWSHYYLRRA